MGSGMFDWKAKAFGYLEGAFKYRWYGVAMAWAVCLAGWAVVAMIPDRYQASAKVYIDTDNLMGPLLRGIVVNQDPAQQIPIMLNKLITRPNIEQVIRLTKPQDVANFSADRMEDEITNVQRAVAIRPVGPRNLYTVAYTDPNGRVAVAVTQTLLNILVDSNIGDKRRDSVQAQTFIDKHIDEYGDLLRQAEKRRTDFRQTNIDVTVKGGGAARLDAANATLSRTNEELSAALTRRDTLQKQIDMSPPTVPAGTAAMVVIGGTGANGNNTFDMPRGSPQQMLEQLKIQLSQMLLKYTDEHPDVIALKKTIAKLAAEASARLTGDSGAENNSDSATVPNPIYVQLRARLAEEEVNVAVARQRVDEATREQATARAQIGKALDLERQQADLDRDYNVISENYQSLVKSREAARMGQAVTDEQSPIVFDVIEPPVEAHFPVAPNRLFLNSAVMGSGIAAGLGLTLLLFLLGDKFMIPSDVAAHFGLPVIGAVTRLRRASKRRLTVSAAAFSATLGLLFAMYMGVLLLGRDMINNFMGG
jgi:polysaccharide chain length determinant protein (PEP-CTERM system associated)